MFFLLFYFLSWLKLFILVRILLFFSFLLFISLCQFVFFQLNCHWLWAWIINVFECLKYAQMPWQITISITLFVLQKTDNFVMLLNSLKYLYFNVKTLLKNFHFFRFRANFMVLEHSRVSAYIYIFYCT